jgi:hypothetical protein
MVEWKVFTWLDADDCSTGYLQIHPTLHSAIAAMGRHIALHLLG